MKPVKCDPAHLQMARAALIEKLRPRLMKPVKCDPAHLQMARAALIEKLRPRLEPVLTDVGGVKSVSGFRDPDFISAFGPGLAKLPDSELVNQALALLTEHVASAPAGKTGLPLFDAQGQGMSDR